MHGRGDSSCVLPEMHDLLTCLQGASGIPPGIFKRLPGRHLLCSPRSISCPPAQPRGYLSSIVSYVYLLEINGALTTPFGLLMNSVSCVFLIFIMKHITISRGQECFKPSFFPKDGCFEARAKSQDGISPGLTSRVGSRAHSFCFFHPAAIPGLHRDYSASLARWI